MTPTMLRFANALLVVAISLVVANGQELSIRIGDGGQLEYGSDRRRNRIPDFSHCGYRGANREIPHLPAKVIVKPSGTDETVRLQNAINYVSQLDPGQDGFRGAVLLGDGEFLVSGQLKIDTSGVVLRGHGASDGGTTIRATRRNRRSLIGVHTSLGLDAAAKTNRIFKVDDFVPLGATCVKLDSTEGLSVGQRIEVVHRSSKSWISTLGTDRLGWREGTRDIRWERTIAAVDGERIEIDVPLTMAIDISLSQATVHPLTRSDDLNHIGIEDLTMVSDFDERNPRDEEHAWYGINMQGVRDAWVQRVQFRHFAGGAVMLGDQTACITVADCASFAPKSEVGGYRRHTFFTQGQQCLFLRCWSESGFHDFCVGHCAAGPNAFVHCYATNALGDSGPRESCASGVLYDNVRIEGNDLNLMNRWNSPPKAGWSAINCLLWQCQAANVRCESPPVGNNWAIGIWATSSGDGYFESLSEFVKPTSLYQQQLKERLGQEAAARVTPFLLKPVGATNPSIDQAREFTVQSTAPARQLIDLIREKWQIGHPPSVLASIPNLEEVELPSTNSSTPQTASRLKITNGWLTVNGKLLTGDHYTPMWWRGNLERARAKAMGPAITRFAPGRNGTGLTDDLHEVARHMASQGIVGYDHHYGLWYDRRRDDHLMVRRADGEVVPPFYEQPFARSGKGTAWDGLSRYDLTRFNPWYWSRLRRFVNLGERNGFVLFHHNYFQHNILEAGAHWADSPWRPANNVNDIGLPEPPPYVGDKRIFLAERFYDISKPRLRQLHRNYIRKCLNNFSDQHNVIQLTSGEYTGPLSFMQFWLDTIADWEQESGKYVIVALSCTKDVQDAILNDPIRSRIVDVIDIRYWTYTADGQLYAPPGGKSLSPRQHLRQVKPGPTSFDSIVRSVREYRRKFPKKAVTYNAHLHCGAKRDGWAILMGGGSMANVSSLPDDLAKATVRAKPSDQLDLADDQWCLAEGDRGFLIYSNRKHASRIELPRNKDYEWIAVNEKTASAEKFATVRNGQIPFEAQRTIVWARQIK